MANTGQSTMDGEWTVDPDDLVTVASRGGGIELTCTSTGIPVSVRLEPDQGRRELAALARDILLLANLARVKAGATRRTELVADGVPAETLALLGLPTREDVIASEDALDGQRTSAGRWR